MWWRGEEGRAAFGRFCVSAVEKLAGVFWCIARWMRGTLYVQMDIGWRSFTLESGMNIVQKLIRKYLYINDGIIVWTGILYQQWEEFFVLKKKKKKKKMFCAFDNVTILPAAKHHPLFVTDSRFYRSRNSALLYIFTSISHNFFCLHDITVSKN